MGLNFNNKFNTVWKYLPHPIRWMIAALAGSSLVLVGIVLLFLPGPGIPLIVIGVAILATEFAWAEVVYARIKAQTDKMTVKAKKFFKRK